MRHSAESSLPGTRAGMLVGDSTAPRVGRLFATPPPLCRADSARLRGRRQAADREFQEALSCIECSRDRSQCRVHRFGGGPGHALPVEGLSGRQWSQPSPGDAVRIIPAWHRLRQGSPGEDPGSVFAEISNEGCRPQYVSDAREKTLPGKRAVPRGLALSCRDLPRPVSCWGLGGHKPPTGMLISSRG